MFYVLQDNIQCKISFQNLMIKFRSDGNQRNEGYQRTSESLHESMSNRLNKYSGKLRLIYSICISIGLKMNLTTLSPIFQQGASSDIPTSYFISDNTTENMDCRSHTAHLDGMGRTSVLQPEVSTNVEEQKELCCMQVTAADIELQRMWCNFVLAEQKYEYEEIMAQIHRQVVKRAVSRKKRKG